MVSSAAVACVWFAGLEYAEMVPGVLRPGSLYINYLHYMATVYRAYRCSEDFNKPPVLSCLPERIVGKRPPGYNPDRVGNRVS